MPILGVIDQTMHVPAESIPEAAAVRHPRGLSTLFFTEMWERFSYYGMRALLVLFMVDGVQHGGLGMDDRTATAIYGLYTAFVYLASLPGGWMADRLLGAQRAVWIGGIIIAAGHFTLAVHSISAFFIGLILIVLGTGLLKPNISAIVGQLYPEGGGRRDAGFTIFYMGINLGAAIGPLVCSALGERMNWHYGFAAAGVGMVLGVIQFRLTARHLGEAGLRPHSRAPATGYDKAWHGVIAAIGAIALFVLLVFQGAIHLDPVALAKSTTYVIVGVGVAYFVAIFGFGGLGAMEKRRVSVIVVLLLASATFWSGFEQAGSSLNLFAERYTLRGAGGAGFVIPAGWFQALNPVFIIGLAPLVAVLWVRLARQKRDLSIPAKFSLGLLLLGFGFLVMVGAAKLVAQGNKVWPTWLIGTYLLHTLGEICLSPVGLSAVTRLSPPRFVGQMMGLWFLATSLGNLLAGLFAGEMRADNIGQMPGLYLRIAFIALGAAAVLFAVRQPIKRLIGDSK